MKTFRHCSIFLFGISLVFVSSVVQAQSYTFLNKWGTSGTADGQFDAPTDVAVDGSGNVYVTDAINHRIQKFDSSGTFLTKWGTLGTADGQFNNPVSVAVDDSGNVYVVDPNNDRIQKFDSSGIFLTKWGTLGTADGQFNFPSGIAVDSSGNVYVAGGFNDRIQVFSPPSAPAMVISSSMEIVLLALAMVGVYRYRRKPLINI